MCIVLFIHKFQLNQLANMNAFVLQLQTTNYVHNILDDTKKVLVHYIMHKNSFPTLTVACTQVFNYLRLLTTAQHYTACRFMSERRIKDSLIAHFFCQHSFSLFIQTRNKKKSIIFHKIIMKGKKINYVKKYFIFLENKMTKKEGKNLAF